MTSHQTLSVGLTAPAWHLASFQCLLGRDLQACAVLGGRKEDPEIATGIW